MTHPDGYLISDDPARLDLDVIHGYLSGSYWASGISRETVHRSIAGSLPVGAYTSGGEQVGFARAISDRATFAWLADVFVLPQHQGRGLARRMVRVLLDHPELVSLRRWMLATEDAHGVYLPLGFQPLANPEIFMAYRPTGSASRYGASR